MPDRRPFTYNPQRVSVIVGGRVIEGFTEDKFVSATFVNDLWTYQAGLVNGARVRNPNRFGTITIMLQHTSPSNSLLQVYLTNARAGRADTFSVNIRNNSGGELARADIAWIKKEPELGFSKSIETREWMIETGNLQIIHDTDYPIVDPSA